MASVSIFHGLLFKKIVMPIRRVADTRGSARLRIYCIIHPVRKLEYVLLISPRNFRRQGGLTRSLVHLLPPSQLRVISVTLRVCAGLPFYSSYR
jgi:hypothetical protein